MSQGSRLQSTRSIVTDSGTAIPDAGVLQIVGDHNAQTSASGNVITISVTQNVTSKTSNYTASADDYFINCTANSFTVSLPKTSGISGKVYEVKNSGTGTITVQADGSENIDGNNTQTLSQYESLTLISDGSNWYVI